MQVWGNAESMRTVGEALSAAAGGFVGTAAAAAVAMAHHGYWSHRSVFLDVVGAAEEWTGAWSDSLFDRAHRLDAIQQVPLVASAIPDLVESWSYALGETTPLSYEEWAAARLVIAVQQRRRLDGLLRTLQSIVEMGTRVDPAQVAAFFATLPAHEAAQLARLHPEIIGPLPGAPLELRFTANRILIERTARDGRKELDEWLSSEADSFEVWPHIVRLEEELAVLEGFLAEGRHFVLFDWDGKGRVAEWHGPVLADNVVVYVPGTTHSKLTIDGLNDRADVMLDFDPSGGDLAVIAAMVYEAPSNIPLAALGKYADAGGPLLVDFIDGLHLDERHLSVLAHSYGSTTAGEALHQGLGDVLSTDDDIIVIGSPGVRFDSVDDIPHPAEHIWVGLTEGDEIQAAVSGPGVVETLNCYATNTFFGFMYAWSPYDPPECDFSASLAHGVNPADSEFGALVFATGENLPPDGFGTEHGEYWKVDALGDPPVASESLANILAIAVADYPSVTLTPE